METLDQLEMQPSHQIVTPKATTHMRGASPWMVFVGVMFILTGGLMALSSVAVFMGSDQYKSIGMENAFMGIAVFYLIGGIMFGVGGYFLVSSGSKLGTFAKYPNAEALEAYSHKQKTFWTLMGIFWILSIIATIAFVALAGRMASLMTNAL